ncbi:MAG TPA: hypothetical protein VIH35_00225, partial [Kiritimatiellia bacterium]
MSQEWDIKVCGKVCAGTGQPFTDGQPIRSRLSFGQEGYVRQDFSEAGWTPDVQTGSVSFW